MGYILRTGDTSRAGRAQGGRREVGARELGSHERLALPAWRFTCRCQPNSAVEAEIIEALGRWPQECEQKPLAAFVALRVRQFGMSRQARGLIARGISIDGQSPFSRERRAPVSP